MCSTDCASQERYDVSLPTLIRFSADSDVAARNGRTRDLSSDGVYFTIQDDLGFNAKLNLTMILPAEVTVGSMFSFKPPRQSCAWTTSLTAGESVWRRSRDSILFVMNLLLRRPACNYDQPPTSSHVKRGATIMPLASWKLSYPVESFRGKKM